MAIVSSVALVIVTLFEPAYAAEIPKERIIKPMITAFFIFPPPLYTGHQLRLPKLGGNDKPQWRLRKHGRIFSELQAACSSD